MRFKQLNGISGKKIIMGVASLFIVFALSFYLEILGRRILNPSFTVSEGWSMPFITGVLRTFSGAAGMGVLFVFAGLIPHKFKDWTKKQILTIWFAGSSLFLLMIYMLILWAP